MADASSKEVFEGLSATPSSGAVAYSAYAPPLRHCMPRSVSPKTSSPGLTRRDGTPDPLHHARDVGARNGVLGMPYAGTHQTEHRGLAGHDVPHVGMRRRGPDPDQHLVLHRLRHRHLGQPEGVDRAVPVLDDRLHARTVSLAILTRMDRVLLDRPAPGVALVTLNYPERMNSMSFDAMVPLRDLLGELKQRQRRAGGRADRCGQGILLRGRPERGAGADAAHGGADAGHRRPARDGDPGRGGPRARAGCTSRSSPP